MFKSSNMCYGFECVICASAAKEVRSPPNVSLGLFSSVLKRWPLYDGVFVLLANKLHKEVFDLCNTICISSIVSSPDCDILKVRSERPFDKYRKTFRLYYAAFHLPSC